MFPAPGHHYPSKGLKWRKFLKNNGLWLPMWYKWVVQMVLAMSRPHKHPKTGVYYFRRAVPGDLRAIIGKREEKISLRTKDPAEAKAAYVKVAADVENRWKVLRSAPARLTHRQTVALAGEVYQEWFTSHGDEPFEPGLWAAYHDLLNGTDTPESREKWWGEYADALLQRKGIRVDDPYIRGRLLDELNKAMLDLTARLKRHAEGDYRPDSYAERFPQWEDPVPTSPPPAAPVGKWTLTGLVEDWWKEASAAGTKPATYESYRNTMSRFVTFLGHDDVSRVTGEDVVGFKDYRLAEVNPKTGKTISPKTVKDSDLSGLKSLFAWAVSNRRMGTNPATGITIKLGKKVRLRPKGFTDEEARALLKAAWNYRPGREHPKLAAAKKWTPWLCAYTGARIGEMIQLRKEDLRQVGNLWVLTITPEAGTVKTNEARDVVLHGHLVELGFPEFVVASGAGYLFLSPKPGGTIRGPWRTAKNRVTEFVRTVVTDPHVQPNHGWRHRLKTVGMEAGMAPRVLDALQGHTARTAGETYGEVTIKAQALEMAKVPRYDIG